MSYIPVNGLSFGDTFQLDPFGRLRTSSPQYLFDAQLTYDLQPLLFEQSTNGSGATITHDATNRCGVLAFSSTPTGGYARMQSYEYLRYQPGRGQTIAITFNFQAHVANVTKRVGYSDGSNGVEVRSNGTTWQIVKLSDTTLGDETVAMADWNGEYASWLRSNLDISKTLIVEIDLQALYVGRVRVGFNIEGVFYEAHVFTHSNMAAYPYIQTASLPVFWGMDCTGTVTATMNSICCSVWSEGGQPEEGGFHFSQSASITAASGARTHALSIQPKTTFNSITNRTKIIVESVEVLVTGANPVIVEACYGDEITGVTTFNDVNTTYSAAQYNTAGTTSAAPSIVADTNYVASTAANRQAGGFAVPAKYPITLNAAGAARALGRFTVLVTGVGGTSACRVTINWKEIR